MLSPIVGVAFYSRLGKTITVIGNSKITTESFRDIEQAVDRYCIAISKRVFLYSRPRPRHCHPSMKKITRHLQQSVESLAPSHHGDWQSLPLTDIAFKTRLLLSCEHVLGKKVPNTTLGSLQTTGDLLTCLTAAKPPRPTLFFQLRRLDHLPSNLSLQYPSYKKMPERGPFQNYDNPRHRVFPNKKAKERRWTTKRKKRYNLG